MKAKLIALVVDCRRSLRRPVEGKVDDMPGVSRRRPRAGQRLFSEMRGGAIANALAETAANLGCSSVSIIFDEEVDLGHRFENEPYDVVLLHDGNRNWEELAAAASAAGVPIVLYHGGGAPAMISRPDISPQLVAVAKRAVLEPGDLPLKEIASEVLQEECDRSRWSQVVNEERSAPVHVALALLLIARMNAQRTPGVDDAMRERLSALEFDVIGVSELRDEANRLWPGRHAGDALILTALRSRKKNDMEAALAEIRNRLSCLSVGC